MPPRAKIPAHVLFYAMASLPGVGYAMYWQKNKSTDEEFEAMLKKNYGSKIENSRDKKQNMVDLIGGLKNRDPVQESKFQEVLRGGNTDTRRKHPVDDTKYGVVEGEAQKKMLADQEEERKRRKRKRNKKKRKMLEREMLQEGGEGLKKDKDKETTEGKAKGTGKEGRFGKKEAVGAGMVVLGGAAVVTSFLMGGGRKAP